MSDFMFSGLIIGVLAILFWTPYMMACGISKMEGDLTMGERVLCGIPIFNMIRAEKKYYGGFRFVTYSSIFVAVIFLVRVWFIVINSTPMQSIGQITVILMWIGMLAFVVSNMIFVFTVIHDADTVQGVKLILLTVFYMFGQYYIGTMLANVIRHMQEKEATFKQ